MNQNLKNTKKIRNHSNPEPLDKVFNFLMKIYFYVGLVVYLPFFLINSLDYFPLNASGDTLITISLIIFGFLIILLGMDVFGMQSNYLDRISRLIPLIMVIVGAVAIVNQAIFISKGWKENYPVIFTLGVVVLGVFGILGWYFIREEYGLTKINYSPTWNESMTSLLICGVLFFMEYFLPHALLYGIGFIFIIYPFIIIIWGRPKVVPRVKPRKLVNPYRRVTFIHFIEDTVKATAVAGTILIVLYDGSALLFPNGLPSENGDWIRNLAFIALFGALAMYIYLQNAEKIYGLFVVLFLYILTFLHFLLEIIFNLQVWWILAPLNGFSLAGVYFFIEQKITKSDNVRVMSGSYYIIVLILVTFAIIIRSDENAETLINYGRLIVSAIGIAYLIGYMKQSPNEKHFTNEIEESIKK